MNILLSISNIEVGGGQTAVFRLAKGLTSLGHNVIIYNWLYRGVSFFNESDRELLNLKIEHCKKNIITRSVSKVINLLDSILPTDKNFFSSFQSAHFLHVIKYYDIDIVNTHLAISDLKVTTALKTKKIPIIATMHGSYDFDIKNKYSQQSIIKIFNRFNAIIYLTDKNIRLAQMINPDIAYYKIYNGYEKVKHSELISKNDLKIKSSDFVFSMVARGIIEKGWQEAIESFIKVNAKYPDTKLLLVGESDYIDTLRSKYTYKSIYFCGYSENPTIYLQMSDIFLLPTYFSAESLPNSIIEALACGLPVIATDIGEIRKMLSSDKYIAGSIIKLVNEKVDTGQLSACMEEFIVNRDKLLFTKKIVAKAFDKFSLRNISKAYLSAYKETIREFKE